MKPLHAGGGFTRHCQIMRTVLTRRCRMKEAEVVEVGLLTSAGSLTKWAGHLKNHIRQDLHHIFKSNSTSDSWGFYKFGQSVIVLKNQQEVSDLFWGRQVIDPNVTGLHGATWRN